MTTEPSERFRALSRIFDLAVDAPEHLRDDLIRRECQGDPALEREVRALLAADAVAESEAYVVGVIAEEAAAMTTSSLAGRRLGAWAIERPIGEGGMGVVYRAVRADGEYDATAAIKLVRGGAPSALLSERVRSERQILAGLSHPGVAQLLDGGTTEDGTPYLVMEYVDGQPITAWCDDHGLDVEGRLRLFLKVCDAVAYAHGALVAHRDLKPSNILVTPEGEPKLLDFGIAKLVDTVSDSDETHYGVMTPAYASPEQVTGVRAGVATDIYALGVLLYELLSGRLPIETRGLTPTQVAVKITTEVPPLVSASTDDPIRRRRLSGDLDAIVSRALRKEPDRRYDSVASFADDIRLHLDGRAIKARRDDWTYRTWKAVRRNKGMVGAGAALAVMMIVFTTSALFQARALGRERDSAAAERETAVRVSGFLEELLTGADPNEPASLDVTARDVLDRGAERVFAGLREEPSIQAQLAMVMGRVYRRLGEYDAAASLLDSAVAVLQREVEATPEALGDALIERSALWYDVGDYDRALELAEQARTTFAEAGSGDDPRMASALDWMGASLQELGRMEEAERYTAEMVEMYRRLDPEPNADLGSALTTYTDLLRTAGDLERALEIGEEALAMARQLYGNDHLEVAYALNQMTSTLRELGRAEEAIPLVEEGLDIRRANFDGAHIEIAASLGNVANVYTDVGRLEEAVEARSESHAMIAEIFPEPHPYMAASLNSLGNVLTRVGRHEEAESLLVESVAMHRLVFPPAHPNIAFPLTGLGRLYLEQGRFEEAEPVLREAYEARSGGLPEGHWEVAPSALELARALDALGRDEEAEAFFEESHTTLLENFGPDDARTSEARDAFREHLVERGMTERAARLGN